MTAATACCHEPKVETGRVGHPLQPLTADEILSASAIVNRDPPYGHDTCFETIELLEPGKEEVRSFVPGTPIRRNARVNVFSSKIAGVTSLIVSIDDNKITSRKEFPGKHPIIQVEQFVPIEEFVRKDPRFIAACAKRGVTDMSRVCIDPWPGGNFGVPEEDGRHLCHVFAWLRLRENDNFYAHPIEGLNAVIDLKSYEVIRVDDHGAVPIPQRESNYDSDLITHRAPLKPINVVQPDGVNFRLDGHRLTWDKWSFVIGFNNREGLTFHDISFDGRPVIYRASLVEMVVPYGSPRNGHYRKNVFDFGEYGMGKMANSLKLGCDCLGVIEYLDAHLSTMDGQVQTIENAVCIHEEDAGLLWKHTDWRSGRCETRRARKLVVSMVCTVGNYEYALYWYFFLDGSIEFETKATGIVNTAACLPGKPDRYGREVSPGVVGQIHQHLFCARLDMAVDGDRNTVVECNTYAEPMGPANPYGNAFYEKETVFTRETEAARRADPATLRYWKVINPGRLNYTGTPVGYKLDATDCILPLVHPEAPNGRRAGFVQNHLWVTAYDPEERFPTGLFVNQSTGDEGLEQYVQQNRPIENSDIVLWHVFGLHHPVRLEDYPVQPCVSVGFKLMPTGFFDGNPTIDLPPETNAASCSANAGS